MSMVTSRMSVAVIFIFVTSLACWLKDITIREIILIPAIPQDAKCLGQMIPAPE